MRVSAEELEDMSKILLLRARLMLMQCLSTASQTHKCYSGGEPFGRPVQDPKHRTCLVFKVREQCAKRHV